VSIRLALLTLKLRGASGALGDLAFEAFPAEDEFRVGSLA
jgi:hypothetical protein